MSDQQPPPEDFPTRPRPALKPQRPAAERISGAAPTRANASTRGASGAEPTRAYTPPQAPEAPADPGASGLYVPWWGFALVILVVAAITCGLWGLVLSNRDGTAIGIGPTPTPIFVVITSTPTLGAAPEQATAPPDTEDGPTHPPPSVGVPELSPSPPLSVAIQTGSTVMVTGTEGDGVAIRQGPGLDYTYFFVGNDGDVFLVEDGPREGDGYTWWYLKDPADPNRFGWAVDIYLQVVQP